MAVDKNKNTAKADSKLIVDAPVAEKVSFPSIKKGNKRRLFFYGMVAVDVFGFRNVERDANTFSLSNRLVEETGRNDGTFTGAYAERVSYTEDMYFDFVEDTPEEYKSIETWWNMVKDGVDPSECYVWYVSNVPNVITNQFSDAVDDAHTVWKPAYQQLMTKEEEAKKDPN